jgi:hypothetical protein
MHHLDIKQPYRGCSVRSSNGFIYFMLNPTLVRSSGLEVSVFEDSQSCVSTNPLPTVRRDTIELAWTDGVMQFQSIWRGNAAIALQLVLEEFNGNKHCKTG